MTTDTLPVAAAFVANVLTIALTATWRHTLKPWWQRFTWTPRLTPGIRAEVIMVMSADGHVGIQFEKLAPEENASEVFARLTEQWFAVGEAMGVNLNWSSKIGAVMQTPEGPEYVIAMVRPSKAKVREITEVEMAAMGDGDTESTR